MFRDLTSATNRAEFVFNLYPINHEISKIIFCHSGTVEFMLRLQDVTSKGEGKPGRKDRFSDKHLLDARN